MVLDSFRIDPGGFLADTEREQEGFNHPVPLSARGGKVASRCSEKYASIRLLLNQPVSHKTLQHLRDGGLRHAKALGDINLPRLASMIDQIGNQFDVVLREFRPAVVPDLSESFHVRLGVRKGRGLVHLSSGHRFVRFLPVCHAAKMYSAWLRLIPTEIANGFLYSDCYNDGAVLKLPIQVRQGWT